MGRGAIMRLAAAILACCLMQSCSAVYLTTSLEPTIASGTSACHANMGTYFLPKGELSFVILRKETTGPTSFRFDMKTSEADGSLDGLAVVTSPDERQQHCLDFRRNGFYSDLVRVQRTENGLLSSVYSNVEDQSKEIIESAAKGISLAVAAQARFANRDFIVGENKPTVHMKMQFDPFDLERLSAVNQALKSIGYCISIDANNDPFVPFWMHNQCSTDKRYIAYSSKGDAEEVFSSASYTAGDGRLGILYKPALSHTLVIYKRDDPSSGKPWRIWKRQIIELPNRAPIFMLQVSRGFFTSRKTEISFNQGMLTSIQIDKKSELKAVSDAFVNIVGIVIQIPAKALILETNTAKNQEALIKANQTLLQAYADLEAEQKKRAGLQNGADAGGVRTSIAQTRAACLDYADLSEVPDPSAYCQMKAVQQ